MSEEKEITLGGLFKKLGRKVKKAIKLDKKEETRWRDVDRPSYLVVQRDFPKDQNEDVIKEMEKLRVLSGNKNIETLEKKKKYLDDLNEEFERYNLKNSGNTERLYSWLGYNCEQTDYNSNICTKNIDHFLQIAEKYDYLFQPFRDKNDATREILNNRIPYSILLSEYSGYFLVLSKDGNKIREDLYTFDQLNNGSSGSENKSKRSYKIPDGRKLYEDIPSGTLKEEQEYLKKIMKEIFQNDKLDDKKLVWILRWIGIDCPFDNDETCKGRFDILIKLREEYEDIFNHLFDNSEDLILYGDFDPNYTYLFLSDTNPGKFKYIYFDPDSEEIKSIESIYEALIGSISTEDRFIKYLDKCEANIETGRINCVKGQAKKKRSSSGKSRSPQKNSSMNTLKQIAPSNDLQNINPNFEEQFKNDTIAIPKYTFPIDDVKKQKYLEDIENNCDIDSESKKEIKNIYKKYIDNMRHVSFDEFIRSIIECVKKFEENIKNEYVLYIPYDKTKSNYWCSQIVYHLLNKKPAKIMSEMDLKESGNGKTKEMRENNLKNIKNYELLLCDDGMYSGQQMETNLFDLKRLKTKQINIICPYISEQALDTIKSFKPQLYYVEIIKNTRNFGSINRHMLYFDHKLPDRASILTELFMKAEYPPLCKIKRKDPYYLIKNCVYDENDDPNKPRCPYPPYKNKTNKDVIEILSPEEFIKKFRK